MKPPIATCYGRCVKVFDCAEMGSCQWGCLDPKLPRCKGEVAKVDPSRKRRLAKVARATGALEAAILTLKTMQRLYPQVPTNVPITDRIAGEDMAALYYLSRLARQAP